MPAIDLSFMTQRKWQIPIGIAILCALYFVFRPERDPAEVIRENLYVWAGRLEKSAPEGASGGAATAEPTPAAMLEGLGDMRRLVRDAFTENAVIQARRGPQEQGREAITKWCFTLRSHADIIAIELSDITVQIDPDNREQATANLRVKIMAHYQGRQYTQNFQCELRLERDKKWRIAELTANTVAANDNTAHNPQMGF